MELRQFATRHLQRMRQILEEVNLDVVKDAVRVLSEARRKGKNVFVFGNGGSAANAIHLASDLNKVASPGDDKFRAQALTANVPLMTAWANDSDYSQIFVRQLANFLTEGDVVIGLSCSGDSENVVAALELARRSGATTIAMLGFDGGRAKTLVDYPIWLNDDDYGRVEDAHSVLCHVITEYLAQA